MSAAPAIVDAWTFKQGQVPPILPDAGLVHKALQDSDDAGVNTAVGGQRQRFVDVAFGQLMVTLCDC